MGEQPITGSCVGEQFKDYETHDTEEEFTKTKASKHQNKMNLKRREKNKEL